MEIKIVQGRPEKYPCELLLLFSFELPERLEGPIQDVDLEWKGFISTLMKQGDFKGELYQCRLFHTHNALPAQRVLLAGLGKRDEFDLERWRGVSSKAGQFIREGLQENPGDPQLLFDLGRMYSEQRHDSVRARNLWEAGLRNLEALPDRDKDENKFMAEQLLGALAKLEEQTNNPDKAIALLERLKALSPQPEAVQKWIEDVKARRKGNRD